ncbi:hypothetical protein OESDEN_11182 [Oesophagostomum dentatum]|uniref:Uncharacterized protein n=1 Tax=Oesophagostomum dentatum TaxID=61180 RepID=A0A0B1SYM0_OESDE|nr:hypothetical protein OESDEN_11182 [Oesophagostomum dentatum]
MHEIKFRRRDAKIPKSSLPSGSSYYPSDLVGIRI